ncbi:MAG: hypothetical protein H7Z41_09365, partial [Cytophagales bacterium]|nr:hypothetical protein [Armatimonadota bacterium]
MTKNIWKTTGIVAGLMIAGIALADPVSVKLSGDQEVPPVTTSGSGSGTITVGE